jgi:hypothetical protein
VSARICILGSSYIGALYKAYQQGGSARHKYEVDFYGRQAGSFREMRISDGHVRGARFSSREDFIAIDNYDAFVIYADLPAPQDLEKVLRECRRASASGQLMKALVGDIVRATASFRLARSLGGANGKPVLILSRNVVSPPKIALDEMTYDRLVAMLRRAVAPCIYLPFPRELFTGRFRPDAKFYQGSLDIAGDIAGTDARRDRNHMNELGGRLMLDTILDGVDAALQGHSRVTESNGEPSATAAAATCSAAA